MASFSSLPPELVADIVELAVPPSVIGAGIDERIKTLVVLCLTSKALRQPAQVLLYRGVKVKEEGLSKLAQVLAGRSPQSGGKVVQVNFEWHGANIDALRTVVGRLNPEFLEVEYTRDLDLEAIMSNADTVTLLLKHASLRPAPSSSFVGASLRRFAFYGGRLHRDPHLLLNSHTLPGLRTFALSWPTHVEDHEAVNSPGPPDDPSSNDFDIPRPFALNTMDIPLLPQLKCFSTIRLDLVCKMTIEVLDVYFPLNRHVQRVPTSPFPTSLKVLRLYTYDERVSPSLPHLLRSHDPPLSLIELHLVGFAEEDGSSREHWTDVRAWCTAQGVGLFVSRPDDLQHSSDPSFWRFLDTVQRRLGLDV